MQTIASVDLLELIGRDTTLKYEAATCGGEWSGACPFCGGKDRLRVQPEAPGGGRWWCRRCAESDHWYHAIDYVRRRRGLNFHQACATLQIEPPSRQQPRPPAPPAPVEQPGEIWQARAEEFVRTAITTLWCSASAAHAIQWVKRRGLSVGTISDAELGFNRREWYAAPEIWGLPPTYKKVWLPAGIVIPWRVDKHLWRIYIRRLLGVAEEANGEKTYIQIAGCANALYNADELDGRKPVILVEGVFDALAIRQEASDLVVPVATGTTGARRARWIAAIARAPFALLGYDNDDAGEKAARAWADILQPQAYRWRPYWDDPAAMLQAGTDIRSWVQHGLEYAYRQSQERIHQ